MASTSTLNGSTLSRKAGKKNYTPYEKSVLKKLLIDQENKILFSKKTDAGTNASKQVAWKKIEKKFNATKGCSTRNVEQLKKLYANMKTELKLKVSAAKRDAIKTGGGIGEVEYQNDAEMEFLDYTIDIELKDSLHSDSIYLQKRLEKQQPSQNITGSVPHQSAIPTASRPNVDCESIYETARSSVRTESEIDINSLYQSAKSTYIGGEDTTQSPSDENLNKLYSEVMSDIPLSDDELEEQMQKELFKQVPEKKKKKTKMRFTFEDLLKCKKESINKMEAVKSGVYFTKEEMLRAKQSAAKAKEEYYKARMST